MSKKTEFFPVSMATVAMVGTTLFSQLPLMMTKSHAKFHPYPISSFREKVEHPHTHTQTQSIIIQNRIEQNRIEQNRIEQNRKEQNRIGQNRLEQNRIEQNRIDQNRIEQNRTSQNMNLKFHTDNLSTNQEYHTKNKRNR